MNDESKESAMGIRGVMVLFLSSGLLLAGCGPRPGHEAYLDYARRQALSDPLWAAPAPTTAPAATTRPAEPTTDEPSTLGEYLVYAATHNPRLAAADAAWQAAEARIEQASALPDPRLALATHLKEWGTDNTLERNNVEVSQEIPWPGKLVARTRAARQEARAARHRYDAAKLELYRRVVEAYAEYYYLARDIDILSQNIELLGQIEAVARVRYAAGTADYSDVIRAQVEQAELVNRLRTRQSLRAPAVARLNAALNRPATAPLPWPTELPQPADEWSDQQLADWAAQANPELSAMDRDVAARRQMVELARQQYIPDIMLGVAVENAGGWSMNGQDGQEEVMGMISINIPLWVNRIAAGVREARWRHLEAVSQRAGRANELSAELAMALYEFRDAGRRVGLYRDTLIPKGRQALTATQTAYRAANAGFQDYLDAQRTLLQFHLDYQRARADRAIRLAELEMLVGRRLDQPGAEEERTPQRHEGHKERENIE